MSKKPMFLAASVAAIAAVGGLAATPVLAQQIPVRAHPVRRAGQERHPEMRKALRALMNAQNSLAHADHDFHGHRAAALDLVTKAIAEVKAGIASDHH